MPLGVPILKPQTFHLLTPGQEDVIGRALVYNISGDYARPSGSKISHTGGKWVTFRGLHTLKTFDCAAENAALH